MRYYGSLIGVQAGEAFDVREALDLEDPTDLLTRHLNIYSSSVSSVLSGELFLSDPQGRPTRMQSAH